MTGSLLRLSEMLPALSPTGRRIAEYFIANAQTLLGTSIAQVAAACGTGKSSVVHLCKHAGFHGYKDFCNALSAELAVGKQLRLEAFADLQPGASAAEICDTVVQRSLQTLQATRELLDAREVERAAAALMRSGSVALFAVGGSAIVAEDAQYKLRRLGLAAFFPQDAHYQLQSAALLTDKDAAIFVSYRGRTREILELADIALSRGAQSIALTQYGRNPLADLADIRLQVAADEPLLRAGAMASRLAMLLVVDMLHTCVASHMGASALRALERTAEVAAGRRVPPVYAVAPKEGKAPGKASVRET